VRCDGDETFEVYSLGLLRRAIARGDQDAWAGFTQCLEETVLTWLHEHPSRGAACRGLCENHLVGQAFERFRQAAVQAQMAFETQAAMLVYFPRIAQRGCCRAKSDLRSERCSKADAPPARDSRNRRTERKKGGREQEWRTRQEKRRRGSTRRSQLLREEGPDQLSRRA